MLTEYDKTDAFEFEIKPAMETLVQLCNKHHIPFFVATCIKNDESGSEYKADMYASLSNEIRLKKDLFPKFVNVLNGFLTVPPNDELEIMFDD